LSKVRAALMRILRSFAVALICVSSAFAVTRLTWPLLQPTPMALSYAAVLASAWLGGRTGGSLAVASSAAIGYYAFLPPDGSSGTGHKQVVALFVFLAVASALVMLIGRQQRAAAREREQRRWFSGTLSSVGDAVLATDTEGRVTFMNDVAEKLTGWTAKDATGRELEEVFSIFKEGTRERTESPVKRVMEAGHIVGLANHTVLVSKAGAETAIEDSAAPIKDDEGTLRGVILVFRDASEKRRAELAIEDSQRQMTNVLESITDGFVAMDAQFRHTFVNEAAERLIGKTRGELIGRTQWEMFPATVGTAIEANYRRVATDRVTVEFEQFYDPWQKWYSIKASPSRDGGIVLYFRDITERKRAEALLHDQKHILELIAGGSALSQVLDALCRMVEGHSGGTLLASVLVLARDGRLRHGGAPSLPEAYNRAIDGIAVGPSVGSCGTAVYRREPVFVADIATDPLWVDFAELALSHNLRSCWSIPILSAAGEVLGTFAMYHPSPRRPNPEDLQLVDLVTRTASIAIERERAEGEWRRAAEATARRSEQLQKLAEISARINAAHDVESVVRVVTEEARHLVGAKQAATSIVTNLAQPEPLSVVSTSSKPLYVPDEPRITGTELYRVANEEQRPIRIARTELERDPRWQKLEKVALVRPTEGGLLAATLVARGGQAQGLLQLADKAEGEFTEDDEAILVQLSQLSAIAIENARLYEELRGNDRRKDEFLAMLAHELRNPLAAIGNAVSVTTRGGFQEHLEWSMDIIARQMKHLTRLIDDLMDVSRISRGKIELRKDVLDLTPILDSAAATARPLIEVRMHALELDIDRGNLWADVDPTRMEQVVVNLLNNAAKYSDNGGTIRLRARLEGAEVVISVKDGGIGIPPERLPEMFELFAQGDRTLARSEGGLGIGLTVVKKLVEMHDGSVTAHSEGRSKGSEFTVRLPKAARTDATGPKPPAPSKVKRQAARILVVDDNVDTARGMARLLKLLGHEVAMAHSGPEALDVAREHRPEFVLLDIGLPGMDGYEVASRLRREECSLGAVIIAVSGYGQDEDRRRSKEAGFDHHLIKPLDHDALLSLLSGGGNGGQPLGNL
jgi:PAS domain S-box-containing protein